MEPIDIKRVLGHLNSLNRDILHVNVFNELKLALVFIQDNWLLI